MKPGLRRRAWLGGATLLAFATLAGCMTAPKVTGAPDTQAGAVGPWSGRLSVQVEDAPSQSFTAAFELKGDAQSGELSLSTPLGGTVAVLNWQPGRATLQAGSKVSDYESVDALLEQATGTAIPVAALFDWLRGVQTAVMGWRADLSQWASGRVTAKRVSPPPEASLRVILER
jgi:outer membrane lipoprotein LolB